MSLTSNILNSTNIQSKMTSQGLEISVAGGQQPFQRAYLGSVKLYDTKNVTLNNVVLTLEEYNALTTKDPNTIYYIFSSWEVASE